MKEEIKSLLARHCYVKTNNMTYVDINRVMYQAYISNLIGSYLVDETIGTTLKAIAGSFPRATPLVLSAINHAGSRKYNLTGFSIKQNKKPGGGYTTVLQGIFDEFKPILLIEDVLGSADSVIDSINEIEKRRGNIGKILILVDKEEPGAIGKIEARMPKTEVKILTTKRELAKINKNLDL